MNVLQIQPPDTVGQTAGGATSTVGLIVVLAVGLYLLDRYTGLSLAGLWPFGGDGGGSGGGGGGLADGDGLLSQLTGFATSLNGILVGGLALLAALIIGGALSLPPGAGVPFIVAIELVATYLILRELDAYSFPTFALVAGTTTVLALSALGEPIIGTIVNSQVGVIVVIGVLYLGYRALQAYRKGQTTKIIVRGGGGEN